MAGGQAAFARTMDHLPQPDSRQRRHTGAALKFLALRLPVYGGLVLLALLLLGDFASIVAPTRSARPDANELEYVSGATEPEWPHRRGPHYNAISDEGGLLDAWPPEGPPVLWARDLGGGYSGFSAVGVRVFTQAQSTYSQDVLCLDADTGETLWQYRYAWPYESAGSYPGPRATPTWHEGRVYFAGPQGTVGCLRADNGELLWSLNVLETFGGRGAHFGYSCSPLIQDGKVILPVGGEEASIVALDAEDGGTVWTSGSEPASYASAIPVTFGAQRHVVALLKNALVGVDLETGRPLWKHSFSQGYDEHAASPLYAEPHLMVCRPFRKGATTYRLEVDEPDSADTGPPDIVACRVWQSRKMSNDVASSVLVDGYVYGFDLRDAQAKANRPSRGTFTCMELATGEVRWTTDRVGHASLIVADGKLILFNDTGEVLLARASPKGYEELARAKVFHDEICWTAPALSQGRLYLRTPSKAVCLYLKDPASLDRDRLERARRVDEFPKSKRLDLTWLLTGGRESHADLPTRPKLGRSYGYCLAAVLGAAAIAAALVFLSLRWKWPRGARRAGRIVFWTATLSLGIAATPILHRLTDKLVLTWSASLFVMHQLGLTAMLWSRQPDRRKKCWWVSLIAAGGLLTGCLIYFHVCWTLGLDSQWAFLVGFLPSWPIAIPAAYRLRRDGPLWEDVFWAVLSFSMFFWAGGAFLAWAAG